jgi:predicted ArsR family transcriptional regulator
MTPAESSCLEMLREKPMTAIELAAARGVSPAHVRAVLMRLLMDRLVVRKPQESGYKTRPRFVWSAA